MIMIITVIGLVFLYSYGHVGNSNVKHFAQYGIGITSIFIMAYAVYYLDTAVPKLKQRSNVPAYHGNLDVNSTQYIYCTLEDESKYQYIYWNYVAPKVQSSGIVTSLGGTYRGFDKFDISMQRRYADIIHFITQTCQKVGVDCFMVAGTLLGSYRHHGMIPWDIDMDIVSRGMNQPIVMEALKNEIREGKPFKIIPKSRPNKFRIVISTSNKVYSDLLFIYGNSTHFHGLYDMPYSTVFPTKLRPFGGYFIPAPRDQEEWLKRFYGNSFLENCYIYKGGIKKHNLKITDQKIINCSILHPFLPFVNRKVKKDGIVFETLMIGKETLYHIVSC